MGWGIFDAFNWRGRRLEAELNEHISNYNKYVGYTRATQEKLRSAVSKSSSIEPNIKYDLGQFKRSMEALHQTAGRISQKDLILEEGYARLERKAKEKEQKRVVLESETGEMQNIKQRLESLPKTVEEKALRLENVRQSLSGLTSEEMELHKEEAKAFIEESNALEAQSKEVGEEIRTQHALFALKQAEYDKTGGELTKQSARLEQELGELNRSRSILGQESEELAKKHTNVAATAEPIKKNIRDLEALNGQIKGWQAAEACTIAQANYWAGVATQKADLLGSHNQNFGLVTGLFSAGLALGATLLTGGAAAGLFAASTIGGLSTQLEAMQKQDTLQKIMANFNEVPLEASGITGLKDIGAQKLSQRLAEKKIIPGLGRIPQSLEHFGLKAVPKRADLPDLKKILTGIPNLDKIKSFSLGLPKMLVGNKHYLHDVLLNPEFRGQLKTLKRGIGRGALYQGA